MHRRTELSRPLVYPVSYTLRANGIYFSIQVQKQLRIMAPFSYELSIHQQLAQPIPSSLASRPGLSLRSSNKSQLAMERVYGPNCTEQRRSSATLVCDCSQQHAA